MRTSLKGSTKIMASSGSQGNRNSGNGERVGRRTGRWTRGEVCKSRNNTKNNLLKRLNVNWSDEMEKGSNEIRGKKEKSGWGAYCN